MRQAVNFMLAAATLAAGIAHAQAPGAYPAKPVRIVVPFAPGGGVDLVARILAQRLTETTRQSFIVDNRTGASGIIGTEHVAKSPPDGYTLMMGSQTTHAVVPALYPKVPYDPARDFAPISMVASSPLLISVNPSLPARSVKDLIALAHARPGELSYGAASGGTPHMAGELFSLTAGIRMLFVPYKGEGPAVLDVIGGQISLVFANLPVALPHVRGGKLRGLAVTSPERVATAPEFPTVAESGLPGYQTATWFGFFAPAGTPREIVAKLAADAAQGLTPADVREKLSALGIFVVANTPEQFAAVLKAEIPRWAKVVRDSGAKPE